MRPDARSSVKVLALSALIAGGCEPQPQGERSVRYHLEWSEEGLEVDDSAWTVVNEAGLRLTVDHGTLTTYQVSLVPCLSTTWWTPWSPSVAHAGHGEDLDPSAMTTSVQQSLTSLTPERSDWITLPATAYCKVHHLLARSDEDTQDVEDGTLGLSLSLEGTLSASDGQTRGVSLEATLAYGGFLDLEGDLPLGATEITLTRRLSTLLDNAEYEMSEDELSRALIAQLVTDTTLSIESRP